MEEFLRQAFLLSGIDVNPEDFPYIVGQMQGLLQASAVLPSFSLQDVVPILTLDTGVTK
ncbi:hypothetical protein LLE49_23025 [Alicyclobacillus tolerans]|uniref:hypothetical protein n=1 Tax=Alicyclobacillus tolerans TaxID=90970 RepID=UPI001F167FE7|nr:hypothetical protein [Alicyclobacillus tolerans]MCF8567598.1 hypothetical protein [Alicyclobacillus tolerans]